MTKVSTAAAALARIVQDSSVVAEVGDLSLAEAWNNVGVGLHRFRSTLLRVGVDEQAFVRAECFVHAVQLSNGQCIAAVVNAALLEAESSRDWEPFFLMCDTIIEKCGDVVAPVLFALAQCDNVPSRFPSPRESMQALLTRLPHCADVWELAACRTTAWKLTDECERPLTTLECLRRAVECPTATAATWNTLGIAVGNETVMVRTNSDLSKLRPPMAFDRRMCFEKALQVSNFSSGDAFYNLGLLLHPKEEIVLSGSKRPLRAKQCFVLALIHRATAELHTWRALARVLTPVDSFFLDIEGRSPITKATAAVHVLHLLTDYQCNRSERDIWENEALRALAEVFHSYPTPIVVSIGGNIQRWYPTDAFASLVKLHPQDATAWLHLGEALLKGPYHVVNIHWTPVSAATAFGNALLLFSTDACRSKCWTGLALHAMRRHSSTVQLLSGEEVSWQHCLRKAVDCSPSSLTAWEALGALFSCEAHITVQGCVFDWRSWCDKVLSMDAHSSVALLRIVHEAAALPKDTPLKLSTNVMFTAREAASACAQLHPWCTVAWLELARLLEGDDISLVGNEPINQVQALCRAVASDTKSIEAWSALNDATLPSNHVIVPGIGALSKSQVSSTTKALIDAEVRRTSGVKRVQDLLLHNLLTFAFHWWHSQLGLTKTK